MAEEFDVLHRRLQCRRRVVAGESERLGPQPGLAGVIISGGIDRQRLPRDDDLLSRAVRARLHWEDVHRRVADERGDECVGRPIVELLRRRDLLQAPAIEHGDAMPERHRFGLVVSDVDHRGVRAPLQVGDLGAHLDAQFGVEVRQRLIEQRHRRLAHQRTPHGHPLPLSAGELLGQAIEQRSQLEDVRRPGDALVHFVARHTAHLEREGEVLAHGHERIERVVLEHHGDVALLRRQLVDDAVADANDAGADGLETCQHAQQRRLATAGGTDQHHELAVVDGETAVDHGVGAVRVGLADVLEGNARHAPQSKKCSAAAAGERAE